MSRAPKSLEIKRKRVYEPASRSYAGIWVTL